MTRIPTCTYRLQFNRWFTFSQAREIVPYLDALGISDVYASPYFQASPDSLHGYDITDHNKLNGAIGSREDYEAWVGELHAHAMGQILDFVPNHVGIAEPLNEWWMDVLENGPSSRYAPYFDIDWQPLKSDLRDKVLLPILSDQYGRVLERGELQVRFEEGTVFLLYGERRLPIAPGTYRYVLEIALRSLSEHKEEDFYAELQSILTALEYLPKRTETDPKRIAERIREKEIIKRRLERRCAEAPQVQQAIEKALVQINGEPGDPRSFDALDQLLNAQSYRLAFWRVAAEEINYRRFFDVNDLAAIRVELPRVFDAIHRLVLELVNEGAVTGLRIDHPDGLYLPREYFEKLQQRCAKALGVGLPKDGRAIYMLAEKILTGSESLRKDWRVHGTTGYDFANQVAQLFVDSSAEPAITKTFHRIIGHSVPFGHLLYAKKLQVMKLSLANDVDVLGNLLDRLSEQNRWYRDFTLEALSRAVRETIACFPVYRTYLAPGQPVTEEDRQIVERAIAAAKRRNPAMEESVLNFLRDVLLFRFPPNLDAKARAEHTNFVLKFQQATGPIMAKGLEDTVFYIYNRLAALNEVGGDPQTAAPPDYTDRIQAYMARALHEAKLNTSWIQPNEEWDTAMRDFVMKILDSSPRNKFIPAFIPVAKEIARLGAVNSLAQLLLKLTSPGVPDIYQGNVIWDYSLVDPDIRRPLDYNRHRETLESLATANAHDLVRDWADGRIKMFLTQRVSQFRRKHTELFQYGEYLPLTPSGTFAECCVSFAREREDQWIIVIAPRLSSHVGFPPIGESWKDTIVELPETLPLAHAHDLFTCRPIPVQGRRVKLADAMSTLPFAVITNL